MAFSLAFLRKGINRDKFMCFLFEISPQISRMEPFGNGPRLLAWRTILAHTLDKVGSNVREIHWEQFPWL